MPGRVGEGKTTVPCPQCEAGDIALFTCYVPGVGSVLMTGKEIRRMKEKAGLEVWPQYVRSQAMEPEPVEEETQTFEYRRKLDLGDE